MPTQVRETYAGVDDKSIFQAVMNVMLKGGNLSKYRFANPETVSRVIRMTDRNGETLLHHAVRSRMLEGVKYLVETCGASVNDENRRGQTALHYLARRTTKRSIDAEVEHQIFAYLLKQGGDPHLVDRDGWNVWYLAIAHDNSNIIQELIDFYRDPQVNKTVAKHHNDKSMLMLAIKHGRERITSLLLSPDSLIDYEDQDHKKANVFHYACKQKNAVFLTTLLSHAREVQSLSPESIRGLLDAINWKRKSPLKVACKFSSPEVVDVLLEEGVSCLCGKKDYDCLYLEAASNGNYDLTKHLERKVCNSTVKEQATLELLSVLVVKQDSMKAIEIMKEHLKEGDVNKPLRDNSLPVLLLALHQELWDVAQVALELGAEIAVVDLQGRTPLFIATHSLQLQLVKLILQRIADKDVINTPGPYVNTPLHEAVIRGSTEITTLLLEAEADLLQLNSFGETPLHIAARNGDLKLSKILLEACSEALRSTDCHDNTPMHVAAQFGHVELLKLFTHYGHVGREMNILKQSPLMLAVWNGHKECVSFLLENDEYCIDTIDCQDRNPVILACERGYPEILDILLNNNGSCAHCTLEGKNALDIAIEKRDIKCITRLLRDSSWLILMRNITVCSTEWNTPLRKMIKDLPEAAELVFDKLLNEDKKGDKEAILDDLSWRNKFRLRKPSDPINMHILEVMLDNERYGLLNHQLIAKWMDSLWVPVFFAEMMHLVLLVIFLACITAVMFNTNSPYLLPSSEHQRTIDSFADLTYLRVTGLLVACLLILRKVVGAVIWCTQPSRWPGIIFSMSPYIIFLCINSVHDAISAIALWDVSVAMLAIAYFNLVLVIRQATLFGLYVNMLLLVTISLLKMFFIFSGMITAFLLCLHFLLGNQTRFNTMTNSAMKTFGMIIGEIDYENIAFGGLGDNPDPGDVVHSPNFVNIVLVIFFLLINISLNNIFVAVAIGDVNTVVTKAHNNSISQKVQNIMESITVCAFFYKFLPVRQYRTGPCLDCFTSISILYRKFEKWLAMITKQDENVDCKNNVILDRIDQLNALIKKIENRISKNEDENVGRKYNAIYDHIDQLNSSHSVEELRISKDKDENVDSKYNEILDRIDQLNASIIGMENRISKEKDNDPILNATGRAIQI